MAERTAAEIAAAEREAQGLPVVIDDPLAYRDLATLLGRRAPASRQPLRKAS